MITVDFKQKAGKKIIFKDDTRLYNTLLPVIEQSMIFLNECKFDRKLEIIVQYNRNKKFLGECTYKISQGKVTIILYAENIVRCKRETIQFVLGHELGHAIQYLTQNWRKMTNEQMENEADEYAELFTGESYPMTEYQKAFYIRKDKRNKRGN